MRLRAEPSGILEYDTWERVKAMENHPPSLMLQGFSWGGARGAPGKAPGGSHSRKTETERGRQAVGSRSRAWHCRKDLL